MTALIDFKVSAPTPHNHLFHVQMTVEGVGDDDHVDVSMPGWSPGSYLIREYARHVQSLGCWDGDGRRLDTVKRDKATWRLDTTGCRAVTVEYDVYAHDVNVRANHLDDTHGFFTGVALFLYPHGRTDEPIELSVVSPDQLDWQVACGLDRVDAPTPRFRAKDYDALCDSPVHMGAHDPIEFMVDGTVHRMIFWGQPAVDRAALARDLGKVIDANRRMFGDLPYDDYLFITLLSDGAGGGLEHRNSAALIYPRGNLTGGEEPGSITDGYLNFLRLVCHEHFHAWNVKRIRPAALGPFNYQQETYTRDLWTVEGITSYYDTLGLLRADLIGADAYLTRLAKRIHQYERVPGRQLDSLEDASFDAWIKLYRADEHTPNSTVSYYLKGELVCVLLDLHIRRHTDGDRCLDDVLRHIWKHYYLDENAGYPEGAYEAIVSEVADIEVDEFFDAYVRGTDDIDWNEHLAPFGLQLERSVSTAAPRDESGDSMPGRLPPKTPGWLGAKTESRNRGAVVTFVPTASPAHRHGIYAGDEICAVGGWKATGDNLSSLIEAHEPGEAVDIHVFRRGELRCYTVELGSPPPDTYRIHTREDASKSARALLSGWLGADAVDAEYST